MATMLTPEELKILKKELTKVNNIDLRTEDIDYNQVREALIESQLSVLINNDHKKLLISENDDGNYYEKDDTSKKIDEKYYPLINSYRTFNTSEDVLDINFIKKIYNVFENFLNKLLTFKRKGKATKKKLMSVANNIDEFYTKLRVGIMALDGKYDKQLVESLLFLPDLIVYFFRYLASNNVSIISKTKIITALVYIISPMDIIPEAIVGHIGYLDDLYIAINVFKDLLFTENIDKEDVYKLWPGRNSSIDNIDKIFDTVSTVLGKRLSKVLDLFFASLTPTK